MDFPVDTRASCTVLPSPPQWLLLKVPWYARPDGGSLVFRDALDGATFRAVAAEASGVAHLAGTCQRLYNLPALSFYLSLFQRTQLQPVGPRGCVLRPAGAPLPPVSGDEEVTCLLLLDGLEANSIVLRPAGPVSSPCLAMKFSSAQPGAA